MWILFFFFLFFWLGDSGCDFIHLVNRHYVYLFLHLSEAFFIFYNILLFLVEMLFINKADCLSDISEDWNKTEIKKETMSFLTPCPLVMKPVLLGMIMNLEIVFKISSP